MIDQLVSIISLKLKEKYPKELPEIDVMQYALKFLITNIAPIFLIVLYGLVSDNVVNVLFTLGGFSLLRMFSGGYHIKSAELCVFTSIIMIILISEFSFLFVDYILVINALSLFLVLIYAPSNIRSQTRLPDKYDILLKLISITIILINIYISNVYFSVSIFVQSLLLIRSLKGGDKK